MQPPGRWFELMETSDSKVPFNIEFKRRSHPPFLVWLLIHKNLIVCARLFCIIFWETRIHYSIFSLFLFDADDLRIADCSKVRREIVSILLLKVPQLGLLLRTCYQEAIERVCLRIQNGGTWIVHCGLVSSSRRTCSFDIFTVVGKLHAIPVKVYRLLINSQPYNLTTMSKWNRTEISLKALLSVRLSNKKKCCEVQPRRKISLVFCIFCLFAAHSAVDLKFLSICAPNQAILLETTDKRIMRAIVTYSILAAFIRLWPYL